MSSNDLTFPYYVYPGLPSVHGYYDTKKYNNELMRLYDFVSELSELNMENKTHLHITIGAAVEEIFSRKTNNDNVELIEYEFQYQQLYPEHLVRLYNETSDSIIHIIIAPNQTFDSTKFETFKIPEFIKRTPEMKWKNLDNRTFVDGTDRYKVFIFYTMMPTHDLRNEELIKHFKSVNLEQYFDIELIKQTPIDVAFAKMFYEKLNLLFNNINNKDGYVTCFSYCVFNECTNRSHIKNYCMFKEITKLFNTQNKKRILAEWRYVLGSYVVIQYGNNIPIRYISNYVNDNNTTKNNKYGGTIIDFEN